MLTVALGAPPAASAQLLEPGPAQITSGPDSPTNDPTPTFTFEAPGASSYECRLRSTEAFQNCGSDGTYTTPPLTDGSYTFEVRGRNVFGAGQPDTYPFIVDLTPPPDPTITGTDPPSPANDNTPRVQGSGAESGSTVRIYDNANCSGSPVATGSAAEFNGQGIEVTVPDNSTTQFSADARDEAGNVSGCSNAVTYVEDSSTRTPTITGTDPASPSNDNTPLVKGSGAESGSTVRIYANGSCSGTPVGTGTASEFNGPGVEVSVPENSTTQLTAQSTDRVGNVSGCSNSVTYVEDSSAGSPTLTGTDPASPANDNTPRVRGSGAESDSTVRIYDNANCSGSPIATGSAADFNGQGIEVNVPDNSTTQFSADARDGAGNVSGCSNSVTYVEDSSIGGLTITGTDPASPANDNTPRVQGSGAEPASTVRIYANASCSGSPVATGTASEFNGPGIEVTVPDDSTTQFSADARDLVGNVSRCSNSIAYVEDSSIGSPTITGTDPASPANDNTPRVRGSGADADSTVRVYANASCAGSPAATGTASDFNGQGIEVTVPDNSTTQFSADAIDAAGNRSACSNSITYVEDSSIAGLTIVGTDPASPANDNTPRVQGSGAAAGSTVRIYENASCSGSPSATGTAADFNGAGIELTVPDDSRTEFSADARDEAGNVSACSNSVTYVEDSSVATPTITGTAPASPANDNAPRITGSGAESGSTVRIYANASCTGAPVATGSAADFNGPGIQVTVADNSTTRFSADARDGAGNVSSCSNAITYVEDTPPPPGDPPETAIDGGPPPLTKDNTPTFAFSATESGASFRCRIDGGPFASCSSPFTAGALGDGQHLFEVAAVGAGGEDATPAAHGFRVDTRAPATRIEKKKKRRKRAKRTRRTSKFRFAADERDVEYACSVDGARAQSCSSPFETGRLKRGKHVFEVRAIDAAGNVGSPAREKFKVARGGRGGGGGDGGSGGAVDFGEAECAGLIPTVIGTEGPDTLGGTEGPDVILGLGGDDRISGAGGDDTICGGAQHDTIKGDSGGDRISGGQSDDAIAGGSGDDVLAGDDGDDSLEGMAGDDSLGGGAGKDFLSGGTGVDRLLGGSGQDSCDGGSGRDSGNDCERATPF